MSDVSRRTSPSLMVFCDIFNCVYQPYFNMILISDAEKVVADGDAGDVHGR